MVKIRVLFNFTGLLTALFIAISCGQNSIDRNQLIPDQPWEKVTDGLNFPEGPAWDGDNTLYASNCYGGWITRIIDGQVDTLTSRAMCDSTWEKSNGLTVGSDGYLYACEFGKGSVVRFAKSGQAEVLISGCNGERFHRPNDLAFDTRGNLYFTDPNTYNCENPDGFVYQWIRKTRAVERVADSISFPNGIAFSGNGRRLFVCESACSRILRFKVDSRGNLTDREIFIELPGGDPDGIALDRRGNLYVAHFGSGMLYVISPRGKIIQELKTPGQKPTNVEFGGCDYKTLFLTEVETSSIYKIRGRIPGQKLQQFR